MHFQNDEVDLSSYTSTGKGNTDENHGGVHNFGDHADLEMGNVDEEKELDLYLNEAKLNSLEEVNLMEALALETTQIKERVITLFENSKNLFNFDFIKELINDRTLAEATIFKLTDDFEHDYKKCDVTLLKKWIKETYGI
jgi:hypothetical protein